MRKRAIIAGLCIAVLTSIYLVLKTRNSSQQYAPDVSHITVHVEVQRLEQVLFALDSKADIRAFLQEHADFATQFLGLSSPGVEEELAERLHAMIKNPDIQALYQEVQQFFGDCSAIRQQFEAAFRYLRYYYPDCKVPQLATFITGMGKDLYISPDLIVIGLDFFMGEGAKFRPIELPDYILRAYEPDYIVPKTILLLSQQFIETDSSDQTLLAEMLYYGKAYYFAQALLPDVKPSVLLAYTPEQLADVEQHQEVVWEHFIDQELLYVTNHLTKNQYVRDRPFVPEIGQRCPGNIGRWLGWEIVKSYMKKHTTVSLPALMSNPNVQELFTQSGYRPRK